MIDILEIRNTIAIALAEEIGLYTFTLSGTPQTTPAIRVDEGAQYVQEPSVEGLEVVIQPSLEVPIALSFDGYQQTFTALITLKQWSIDQTTLEAMPLLLGALQSIDNLQIGSPRRTVRSAKLDNIETLKIGVSQSFLTQSGFEDED